MNTELGRYPTLTALPGPKTNDRMLWLDVARAVAVLAVVLFHIAGAMVDSLGSRTTAVGLAWRTGAYILSGVRLPLLLFISGVLLSGYVSKGFGRSTTVFRLVQLVYLYIVWTTIYWVVLVQHPSLMQFVSWLPHSWSRQFYDPATPVWYLGGLAVSVLFAALFRKILWFLLAVAAAAAVWATAENLVHYITWRAIPAYALYFLIGVVIGRRVSWIETIGRRAWWATVLGSGFTYVLLMVAAKAWTGGLVAGAIGVSASIFGLVAALLAIERLARLDPVRRIGVAVGRQTISIYLLHIPIFLPVLWLVFDIVSGISGRAVVLAVGPVVAAAVVAAISMWLESLTRRLGATWLWELPRSVASRLGR